MAKLLDDTVNFGLGLFAASKEKVESAVDKLVEKGAVKKEEASAVSKELISRGEAQREEIKKIVDERITKWSDKFNNSVKPMTKDEVRAVIREELEAYENRKKTEE